MVGGVDCGIDGKCNLIDPQLVDLCITSYCDADEDIV